MAKLSHETIKKSMKTAWNRHVFFIMMLLTIFILFGILFFLHTQHEKMKINENTKRKSIVQFDLTGQPTLGSKVAKVSIVEFGDYKCMACKHWGDTIFPMLKQQYIDTKKATFTFIHAPFTKNSRVISLAAEEIFRQNPQAFWQYHKAIYNAQSEKGEDGMSVSLLLNLAKKHVPSVNLEHLERTIQEKLTESAIEQDLKLCDIGDVQSIPTVFVNGKKFTGSWDSYSELKSFIELALYKHK